MLNTTTPVEECELSEFQEMHDNLNFWKNSYNFARKGLPKLNQKNQILKALLKTLNTSILSDAPKHFRAERDQLV